MSHLLSSGLVTALSLSFATVAWAHKPIFSDGSATSPENAIFIDDISISYAAYHEVSVGGQAFWIAFDGTAGQELYARLGVPLIEGLEDFRPVLALVGPGLPDAELPITLPADTGAVVLENAADPAEYFEPFTRTESWILGDLETNLPESGRYYLVAYAPEGQTGKLWVAPGRIEAYTAEEFASLPDIIQRVREFHGVGDVSPPCLLTALLAGGLVGAALWLVRRRRPSARRAE